MAQQPLSKRRKYGPRLQREPQLFEVSAVDGVASRVAYNKVHVSRSTFKAGLAAKVHRWFRLTPSYGPDLVQKMLGDLKAQDGDVVLDPFSGAATTLIESQLEGLTAYGFEINPLLHFVGETSLRWDISLAGMREALGIVTEQFRLQCETIPSNAIETGQLQLPPIHNPTRWWRPDVLRELLILRGCITSCADGNVRAFLLLCLAGVLVPDLTNVTLGRLQLHFIDRSSDDIRVLPTFLHHANEMMADLGELQEAGLKQTGQILLTDSTCVEADTLPRKVQCVITSPPYPNRYSYVWNTRPHLYFLNLIDTAKQASEIDVKTIGGTWGTATSMLMKGTVEPACDAVDSAVSSLVADIRKDDNLMANYAMRYFNLLAAQIIAMERVAAVDIRLAYVVGCSRLKGRYVETDVILGKIIQGLGLGYEVTSIERIRRRNSGKDLHESIVYAWKR